MSDKEVPQMAISDFNLQQINTREYSECLTGSIEVGTNFAIFGRRGSGKTEIAKQTILSTNLAEEGQPKVTAREVYINLSVVERTDMGGYPDMFSSFNDKTVSESVRQERFVNFILPKFFEPLLTGNQPAVILFDEVDKADSSIHAPLLEILQNKSINGKKLINLQSSILTGNLISEGSQRPSLPLLDRTEKYLLSPDTGSWLKWAVETGKIHPSVAAFLTDKPMYLFGSNDGGENYADPSPRGWEYASRVLFAGERLKWPKERLNLKVAGFVGKQAGLEYDIYFEHYQELLPMIKNIFNGENLISTYKQLDSSKQLYAAMIICSRLGGILDKSQVDNPPPELAYIGNFMKHVSEENTLVSMRTQIGLNRIVRWDLDTNKDWGSVLPDISNNVNQ